MIRKTFRAATLTFSDEKIHLKFLRTHRAGFPLERLQHG